MTRTPEEIVARIEMIRAEDGRDIFGVEAATLIGALDYEHAKPFLFEEVAEEDWRNTTQPTPGGYLGFAVEKCVGERGLSALRSLDYYSAWTWLAGEQAFDVFDVIRETKPGNYGANALSAAANVLGLNSEWESLVEDHPQLLEFAAQS